MRTHYLEQKDQEPIQSGSSIDTISITSGIADEDNWRLLSTRRQEWSPPRAGDFSFGIDPLHAVLTDCRMRSADVARDWHVARSGRGGVTVARVA